jgi:hypothetical protein
MPRDIRTSFLLWLVAIGAGVFETALVALNAMAGGDLTGGLLAGVGVRLVIFLVMLHVITLMALGRNWARIALAVLLGGFGTLSLVVGPIQWLGGGHSPADALAGAGTFELLFGSSRILHVAAVLGATWYMFRPAANRYFRREGRGRVTRLDTPSAAPVGSAHQT